MKYPAWLGGRLRVAAVALWAVVTLATGVLGAAAGGPAAATPAIPNKDCLECHADKDLSRTNQAGQTITLFMDEAVLAKSVHATNACVACHSDLTVKHPDDNIPAKPVSCAQCHARQSETYRASAHALALKAGDTGAATCTDCHGTHNILKHGNPASPLHWTKLTATCGECHEQVSKEVQQSVHGKSIAKGGRDAATCIDCHSEHGIEALKTASPVKVSEFVCGKCHASESINTKYRMPKNRVKSFFDSYHGLAGHMGSTRAANCASCHGYHKILPSNDPASTIHKANLVTTCGKCHPGANENFALSKVHMDEVKGSDLGSLVNEWVKRIYMVLIFGTVGLLGAHNLLAWWRKAVAARRAAGRTIERMDKTQRRQHLLLLVSFILLALSGFALKYPDSWLSWMLGANEDVRRWIHRIAGVVLLVVGCVHVVYIFRKPEGRRLGLDLLPKPQDAKDVLIAVKYLLTGKGSRPRFARFGYAEKFEYWAVVWGTFLMGVTGLMIWFKIDATLFVPRWVVEVATTIHYYEAILACLAIIVWHFYHVIFDPEVYPLNWAWWDGKVTEHWMKEEHPLELEARATAKAEGQIQTQAQVAGSDASKAGGQGSAPAATPDASSAKDVPGTKGPEKKR